MSLPRKDIKNEISFHPSKIEDNFPQIIFKWIKRQRGISVLLGI